MSEEDKKQIVRNKSKFYVFGILAILLFAGGALISGFIIKEQPQVLGLSAQSEITNLVSQVGKLIVLPSDELPTVTTISDVSKLNGQSFFRNAKNNDKLLVYTNAKWAILYRPSENKIIEVGSFDVNEEITTSPSISPSPSPTSTPSPAPTATPTPSPSPSISPSSSPVLSPKP